MVTLAQTFAFFLVPGFSLMALSCAIDVLRAANLEHGDAYFSWHLVGEEGVSVLSSSGIDMPCRSFSEDNNYDVVAICGGERSHLFDNPSVSNWLKERARDGTLIGSLSDGAYVVARAGLFLKSRSTIHWKCQSSYREMFPDHDIRMSLFEIDRNRFSCAGGTASLDLMLTFVEKSMGVQTAGLVADNYVHDVIRNEEHMQHMTGAFRVATRNKLLSQALLIMEAELENPLKIADIANQLEISHRQLDRLFDLHLGISPSSHYREMRLSRASGLLRQTSLSIGEIAFGCGFQSASHLSKFFKARFGETPMQYRRH